jgi:hypothetical protein
MIELPPPCDTKEIARGSCNNSIYGTNVFIIIFSKFSSLTTEYELAASLRLAMNPICGNFLILSTRDYI